MASLIAQASGFATGRRAPQARPASACRPAWNRRAALPRAVPSALGNIVCGWAAVVSGPAPLRASNGTIAKVSCMKKDIHPKFFPEAKVFCNGEEVLVCGGAKEQYIVDVWSGNHPFYQGNNSSKLVEDSRVKDFNKRFGDLADSWGTIANLPAGKCEIPEKFLKKPAPKKKGR